ncbi:hypothetical protein [uncultured Ruminococcus sp.]|uniref:hypothetical protein n=1 Tax=uncultured Ruminococcus sp. TaxID=165186 RepID=UPI0026357646|nr:hypothetical protein [uncultured Ruminococcus sp.]
MWLNLADEAKIEYFQSLILRYADKYRNFAQYAFHINENLSSRRTVHNLPLNFRPDLQSICRDLAFDDCQPFWREKKKRTYHIFRDEDGDIRLITVGRNNFAEYVVREGSGFILAGYDCSGQLISLGICHRENNRTVGFELAEIIAIRVLTTDFILKSESFEYSENGEISKYTSCRTDSRRRIQRGVNPDIWVCELHYNNGKPAAFDTYNYYKEETTRHSFVIKQ